MKLNTQPIEVGFDLKLFNTLVKIFSRKKTAPELVIETGTYLGTGTTALVADAIVRAKSDAVIYTIEGKRAHYEQAVKNLKKYDFVQVLYGLSVGREEALNCIDYDYAIAHHEEWPDLIIDASDPISFYKEEIDSCFREELKPMENIFEQLIPINAERRPLYVLDSCGGIGQMEFEAVKSFQGDSGFYLMCDDINHLKHFRTYEEIKGTKGWKILTETDRCVIASWRV